jgi:hypothetical protein
MYVKWANFQLTGLSAHSPCEEALKRQFVADVDNVGKKS